MGDAPPLDYLRGAVNGAHEISSWARKNGYETRLITDERTPVGIDTVRAELDELLLGGADRLLLYFAGHGLSTGAANDLWLLSQWNNERRGVAVSVLRDRLMRYGIEQMILVSDACRSLVDFTTRDLEGDPVLYRGSYDEKIPQMDLWFAASPSRAAWMIPGRTPDESRCVFSGLFVEALDGQYAKAFDPQTPSLGITNFSLADFMEEEVPVLAARYGAVLNPAVTTAIRPPNHVYVELEEVGNESQQRLVDWPDPENLLVTSLSGTNKESRILPNAGESWTTLETRSKVQVRGDADGTVMLAYRGSDAGLQSLDTTQSNQLPRHNMADVMSRDLALIATTREMREKEAAVLRAAFGSEQRPTHFETGSGFSVSGDSAVRAIVGPSAVAMLETAVSSDSSWWRVEPTSDDNNNFSWTGGFELKRPLPLLVELADGRWVGAAALPRFVANFTLDSFGAEAVIFRAIDNPYAVETEKAMTELRAGALLREQAPEFLARLRRSKHADPILGVLAAYLHESMGDIANVHRTAYYYALRNEPIPFDIALLGRLLARRNDDGTVHVEIPSVAESHMERGLPFYMTEATPSATGVVAGAFPWLRQGWGLLDSEGRPDLYPARLSEVSQYLLPSPFTTLDAIGGDLLIDLIT